MASLIITYCNHNNISKASNVQYLECFKKSSEEENARDKKTFFDILCAVESIGYPCMCFGRSPSGSTRTVSQLERSLDICSNEFSNG